MKKLLSLFIVASLCASLSFAAKISKQKNGNWVVKTSFPELMKAGINEDIRLQNNTSYVLNRLNCTVTINGKSHKMRTLEKVKIGDIEEFCGFEDDEMKDEFPFYFGKDGEFRRSNQNEIILTIDFNSLRDSVRITDLVMRDKKLVLIVEDSENGKLKSEQEQLEETGAQVLMIDGKKYLLYGGQAYPVN